MSIPSIGVGSNTAPTICRSTKNRSATIAGRAPPSTAAKFIQITEASSAVIQFRPAFLRLHAVIACQQGAAGRANFN